MKLYSANLANQDGPERFVPARNKRDAAALANGRTETKGRGMTRPYIFCAGIVVAAILIFAGLDRAGLIGMKRMTASIPTGLVSHSRAAKPGSDEVTGEAR
jgi:hypothetical protein